MKCRLCSSSQTRWLFSFPNPRSDIGAKTLSYRRCLACDVVFLHPWPEVKQMSRLYAKSDYFKKLCQPTTSSVINRLLAIRFFPEYDEFVAEYFSSPQTVLDVGCGNGEFLQVMQKKGWRVFGIDKSRVAIANASKLVSVRDLAATEITRFSSPLKFSAITAWHVLEHVFHPLSFVRAVSKHLSVSGRIFMEVPNANSLIFSWFGRDYNWLMAPEHIFYYSPKSLAYLFGRLGLKVERMVFPPRSLLNLAFSLAKIARKYGGKSLSAVVLCLAAPLSVVLGFVSVFLNKTEVVRVVVRHE